MHGFPLMHEREAAHTPLLQAFLPAFAPAMLAARSEVAMLQASRPARQAAWS
jgi:hypothetical protein